MMVMMMMMMCLFIVAANMDETDERGLTPLMYAVAGRWQHVVEHLLRRGVDTSIRVDHSGSTALMQACCIGQPIIVKLLLDSGAKVDTICLVSTMQFIHQEYLSAV